MAKRRARLVRSARIRARPRLKRADRKGPRIVTNAMVSSIAATAFDIIAETLARGDRVEIMSFGTFAPAKQVSREGDPGVRFRLSRRAKDQLFAMLLGTDEDYWRRLE